VITISGMVTVAESRPLLLERDAELARLSALLEKAYAGSGAVVAISGPPGIGKTELLAAVHRIAGERGFRSLRARGRDLEADMAFSVVRQLLEQPVLPAYAGERRRLLAGPARPGRARWAWRRALRLPLSSRRCTGCTGYARTSRNASRCC
jgi:AAA ATPase domain